MKNLCGRRRCPVIARAMALSRTELRIVGTEVAGSSPPGVFVGRYGYPKVSVGPMLPPYHGDTAVLDTPEEWMGRSIHDIIRLRYSLLRGTTPVPVTDPGGSRLVADLQEVALSSTPVDAEARFTKRPGGTIKLSANVQPFGPSAPLRSFSVSPGTADRRLERTFGDTDLKAVDAVAGLYDGGVRVSAIQRALSIGMLGVGRRRKLVPTRWSITATDSIISDTLVDRVKDNPTIDEFRVHTFHNLDNIYTAILMPAKWAFEWTEAWHPSSAWNMAGKRPGMISDSEPYEGRTTYPHIGGCYYSTRLAVAEHLASEGRQAAALVLREIHPGYILPVGVWNVRESIRATLRQPYEAFDGFECAFRHALDQLTIAREHWVTTCDLVKDSLCQKRLTDYMGAST